MIRFEKLRWKNFLSTGNYFNELNFLETPTNLVVGENGAGKTNLIEAIYLVSTFRSFRTSDQRVLLKAGHTEALARLKAFDSSLGLASTFEVRIAQNERSTRKSGSIDGKRIAAAKDFYGRVRAILFTPEDVGMLRGARSGREKWARTRRAASTRPRRLRPRARSP
mgnify:CR=1 FL=1